MTKSPLIRCLGLVKKSPIEGYGVFATRDIEPGEIIEECHILLREIGDVGFGNYYFTIEGKSALPLGYGAIYNHADVPNAGYDFENFLLIFRAIEFIREGEEILIYYGEKWFSMRKIKARLPLRYKLRKYNKLIKMLTRSFIVIGLIYSLIFMLQAVLQQ